MKNDFIMKVDTMEFEEEKVIARAYLVKKFFTVDDLIMSVLQKIKLNEDVKFFYIRSKEVLETNVFGENFYGDIKF